MLNKQSNWPREWSGPPLALVLEVREIWKIIPKFVELEVVHAPSHKAQCLHIYMAGATTFANM